MRSRPTGTAAGGRPPPTRCPPSPERRGPRQRSGVGARRRTPAHSCTAAIPIEAALPSRIASAGYTYGTTRLARSVIHVRSLHGTAIHPTQKPVPLLDLLIRYGSRPEQTVLDPFAGSGSTGIAARAAGRRAILIEADEQHCQQAARWLAATCVQS